MFTSTTSSPVIRSTDVMTLRRTPAASSVIATPYSAMRSMSTAAWVSPTSTDTPSEWLTRPPGIRSRSAVMVRAEPVLVRRARLGDEQAFAAIVTRHGAALYRYASRVVGDRGRPPGRFSRRLARSAELPR
nr:hypothetical protein [Cryptosporangium arvum]